MYVCIGSTSDRSTWNFLFPSLPVSLLNNTSFSYVLYVLSYPLTFFLDSNSHLGTHLFYTHRQMDCIMNQNAILFHLNYHMHFFVNFFVGLPYVVPRKCLPSNISASFGYAEGTFVKKVYDLCGYIFSITWE